jgi:hypothetical protein
MAKGFVYVDAREVTVRHEWQLAGGGSFCFEKSKGRNLSASAEFAKVTIFDNFEATLATMPCSIGYHIPAIAPCNRSVNQRALEGPNSIHSFRSHEFCVEVFVMPTASHRNDTLVFCGAVMKGHEVVKFGVKVCASNVFFGFPVNFIFQDWNVRKRHRPIF